eukprot:scaffold6.g2528.t1
MARRLPSALIGAALLLASLGAATGPGAQRPPDLLPPDSSAASDDERFVGFCNQLEAFLNAAAIAHLLNASLVLPAWYSHFDKFGPEGQVDHATAQYDPQARYAVPMARFWDVDALARRLAGVVKVVPELPAYLGPGEPLTARLWGVDPSRPSTLLPYRQHLRHTRVLRLPCTLRYVTWATQEMGELRRRLMAALRPSAEVLVLVRQRQAKALAALGASPAGGAADAATDAPLPPYVGLHLRHEADWRLYCEQEALYPERSWVEDAADCFVPAAEVAARLGALGLAARHPLLFVASAALTEEDARRFVALGFAAVVSARVACSAERCAAAAPAARGQQEPPAAGRELAAAVDLQLMLGSTTFVGNVYSSFSATVRLARLAGGGLAPGGGAGAGAGAGPALYYNPPPWMNPTDVSPLEAHRMGIAPGVLPPALGARAQQCAADAPPGECAAAPAGDSPSQAEAQPSVLSVQLLNATYHADTGLIAIRGAANCSAPFHYPVIRILFDGLPVGGALANGHSRVDAPDIVTFSLEVPAPADNADVEGVSVAACAASGTGGRAGPCSAREWVDLVPALQLAAAPGAAPVVYIYSPLAPDVPEPQARLVLHQLHQEINRWHSLGELAVRSVLPGGAPQYRGRFSDFAGEMEPRLLSPRDYLVVPGSASAALEDWWWKVAAETGAVPLALHDAASQPPAGSLPLDPEGVLWEGPGRLHRFKPLCASPWLGAARGCARAAVLAAPAAPALHAAAAREPRSGAKVPRGAKVVLLHDLPPAEVVSLYRRAKVSIHGAPPGPETAAFEPALLGVVPLVAEHPSALPAPADGAAAGGAGGAPARWRWRPWDYGALSRLVGEALAGHAAALADFAGGAAAAALAPQAFSMQVWRYFQDDVHVVISALPPRGPAGAAVLGRHASAAVGAALASRALFPFSSQELLSANPFYFQFDYAAVFAELESADGAMFDLTASPLLGEYARFGPMAAYLQPPQARHYRDHVLVLPPGALPLAPGAAAALFGAALRSGAAVVAGPAGLLLARRDAYYPAVARALPRLAAPLALDALVAALGAVGLPVLRVDSLEVSYPDGSAAADDCPVVALREGELGAGPARAWGRHARCGCRRLLAAGLDAPPWEKLRLLRLPVGDEVVAQLEEARAWCAARAA